MTKRLLLSCFALAVAFSPGCLHSKKNAKNTTISGEVEGDFRQLWIDKRAGELVAQGKTEAVARAQATDEFHEHYEFIGGTKP